jgi:hypothetical protein
MQIATGETVVQRIVEGAFNRGDLTVIDQLVASASGARNKRDTAVDRREL